MLKKDPSIFHAFFISGYITTKKKANLSYLVTIVIIINLSFYVWPDGVGLHDNI